MLKQSDFMINQHEFHFKKDAYPISKINNVRVKNISLLDNAYQILFWLVVFSGALWWASPIFDSFPFWWEVILYGFTGLGFIFALLRCARFALQIEFRHIDETGIQWINVTKSYSKKDAALFRKQVEQLRQKLA
ncbi:hypothetical protein QWZ04_15920 [Vibrio tapetis subsp. quintayensis]|uniref:hypothetical protein n=1 Tax=Vibrio tapetis TaxID=52443 RepID=UPI0025B29C7B|nr:hypothetical protein [Vibrio tapetis]MDN3681792.1 hypothetical protein [Vibrio tapetis subsp. quintayensis]